MSDLTLNPGAASLVPAADKSLTVPALPALDARHRTDGRARRRFTSARPLQIHDGGFRPFRVY
ncbi:MAG TPA: hypothetical protein VMD56_04585 [Steroidobacteraceae bacterium]|nr:hypothetical protein [Steroidobacteraceae bacterium]